MATQGGGAGKPRRKNRRAAQNRALLRKLAQEQGCNVPLRSLILGEVQRGPGGSWEFSNAVVKLPVTLRGLHHALAGDQVAVSTCIAPATGPVPYEGPLKTRVASVQLFVSHAIKTFDGLLTRMGELGVVTPFDAGVSAEFYVLPEDPTLPELAPGAGAIVTARILEYPAQSAAGVCTLETVGETLSPLATSLALVRLDTRLPREFSPAALAQAAEKTIDVEATLAAEPARKDKRALCAVTIDPPSARDFDDALSCWRTPAGGWHLEVHIADVTHFVRAQSPLDSDARVRATSVYLPGGPLHMLPPELSCNLCSLEPGKDRLALTCELDLTPAGEVAHFTVMTSAITSTARLTYSEVDAYLQDPSSSEPLRAVTPEKTREVGALLEALAALAKAREQARAERGALMVERVEPELEVGEAGHVAASLHAVSPASQLVEEAMLLANEGVAAFLLAAEEPTVYRVHAAPAQEDLAFAARTLLELGLCTPLEAAAIEAGEQAAWEAPAARAKAQGQGELFASVALKAQQKAEYSPKNSGHYALAAPAYCHFTSPIRRYADIVVHRSVKHVLGQPAAGPGEWHLKELCRRLTRAEVNATAAERHANKLLLAGYYQERLGTSELARVTGVTPEGTFVALATTGAWAYMPVAAMGGEAYVANEGGTALTGEATGTTVTLGDVIQVRIEAANVENAHIDVSLVAAAAALGAAAATPPAQPE